jgi:hypothetical protein
MKGEFTEELGNLLEGLRAIGHTPVSAAELNRHTPWPPNGDLYVGTSVYELLDREPFDVSDSRLAITHSALRLNAHPSTGQTALAASGGS